ncbi:MAG: sigma-70 factor domain-containing protein, partial [Candidatus Paceibacterota bacterium]
MAKKKNKKAKKAKKAEKKGKKAVLKKAKVKKMAKKKVKKAANKAKGTKKALKPKTKKGKKKAVLKKSKKAEGKKKTEKKEETRTEDDEILHELLTRGRNRGFVTDTELISLFPNLEDDIEFLEEVYELLEKENVKVIESNQLIDVPSEKDEISKKELEAATDFSSDILPDAVQVYLKEIGKTPLLTFAEEKELAKRAEQQDEEARHRLIKSNLRLVVSIAKRYVNRSPNLSILDLI